MSTNKSLTPSLDLLKQSTTPEMLKLLGAIDKYREADLKSAILVTGETGAGKEIVARALHESISPEKTFMAVNCAAIPDDLIASELFGYVKGAFTGAEKNREGLFESVGEGTIFLDEIGDAPANLQVSLLRVLQEGTFSRVGEHKTRSHKARIITATNKPLIQAINDKKFREDLYYRITSLTLRVPSLRERPEDIIRLTNMFLQAHGPQKTLSPALKERLTSHDWPGNIRQLKNVVRYLSIMGEGDILEESDLEGSNFSEEGRDHALLNKPPKDLIQALLRQDQKLSDIMRLAAQGALSTNGQDREAAAKTLDIDVAALGDIIGESSYEEPQTEQANDHLNVVLPFESPA